MNSQKLKFLLPLMLLISLYLQAQVYDVNNGQVTLRIFSEDCKMETINKKIRGQINRDKGVCSFMSPTGAFHFDPGEKQRFDNCYSPKDYPVITFSGQFENLEKWVAKKEGSYRVKLKGDLKMRGVNIPFSEYVSIASEKGNITLSFTTDLTIDGLEMEMDVLLQTKSAKRRRIE